MVKAWNADSCDDPIYIMIKFRGVAGGHVNIFKWGGRDGLSANGHMSKIAPLTVVHGVSDILGRQ
jgi:hypothetical protein